MDSGARMVQWMACNPHQARLTGLTIRSVTMAGNSRLTQNQWFICAERPPHLTCLCPYEGWNDMYNDNTNRGGIPDPAFQQFLLDTTYPGLGKTEDVSSFVFENPTWNDYYEKRKA